MTDLPKMALSIRQPWAWAIIHGGKDIENRSWQAVNHGLKVRGRIAIHAAKGLQRDEYLGAEIFINDALTRTMRGIQRCPPAAELLRGGIIGSVDVVDVVTQSASPWWMGPRGLVLANPQACEFIPVVGNLGYFEWTRADPSIMPMAAAWMLPPGEKRVRQHSPLAAAPASMADLFK